MPKEANASAFIVHYGISIPLDVSSTPKKKLKNRSEIDYLEGFLKFVMQKLNNERFVATQNRIVANERKTEPTPKAN